MKMMIEIPIEGTTKTIDNVDLRENLINTNKKCEKLLASAAAYGR